MNARSFGRFIFETVILIVLAFILAQGIKTFLIEPYLIPSGSMIPTIELRDRVLADKLSFWVGSRPKRGDIVVLDDPTDEFPQLIKRVIAIGGDTLDLRDGKVYLNDEILDEPYTYGKPTYPLGGVTFPLEVPYDSVFVMGDNRTNSADGRVFGITPLSSVNGRGFWTYWPITRFGVLR
ncbi:MAG: signal peptidase I [Coriobacteriia bacterium]|nr:signal peptidase I [Coriobacteriia bacterium]